MRILLEDIKFSSKTSFSSLESSYLEPLWVDLLGDINVKRASDCSPYCKLVLC